MSTAKRADDRHSTVSGMPAAAEKNPRLSCKDLMDLQGMKDYKRRYKEKGSVRKHCRLTSLSSSDMPGLFACRKLKHSDMPCQDESELKKHLSNLSNLEHPHICRFIETFTDKDFVYLVYEQANPQTLFEHVTEKSSLTEEEAADYLRQAAMAMSVAHSQGIVHGRFSPRSLILSDDDPDEDSNTQIQICDMGQGFVMRPDIMQCEDSPKILEVQSYAISPEIASNDLVGNGSVPTNAETSDIWSLGVVFYHMLSGRSPFKAQSKEHIVDHLTRNGIEFEDNMWSDLSKWARDLIEQMMKLNPGLRITAAQTLRHPWVQVAKTTFPKKKMCDLLKDMHNNVAECEFKRFVMRVIAEHLPMDGKHVATVENAYRCLDRNGDGILSVEEVIKGLNKNLNKGADDREMEDLFAQIDRDGSGTLNVQEFISASMPQTLSTSIPALWDVFNAFDQDRSGHVSFDELDRIVREIEGGSLSKELVSSMCRAIRSELEVVGTDNEIDFDQFVYIMKNSHPNFSDAVRKDWNRWLWNSCGVDKYNVRHTKVRKKWDLKKRRGARSAYRRRSCDENAIDEAG